MQCENLLGLAGKFQKSKQKRAIRNLLQQHYNLAVRWTRNTTRSIIIIIVINPTIINGLHSRPNPNPLSLKHRKSGQSGKMKRGGRGMSVE